jgi:hypothetical protein
MMAQRRRRPCDETLAVQNIEEEARQGIFEDHTGRDVRQPRYRLSYNINYGKSGRVSSCSDYSISPRKSIRVVPDFDSSRYSIPPRKWKLLAFAMRLRSFADSLALSPANLSSRSRISASVRSQYS